MMIKSKKTIAGTAMITLALTLSACGGGGESTPPPSDPQPENPVLSVPETTESKNIAFKVDPGKIPAGQSFHVGVYGGGFGDNPSDCAEEISGVDGQFGEDASGGNVQVKEPGKYQLVLSTEGHSSACDEPNATTTVKTKPEIFVDGNLNTDGAQTLTTDPGKAFKAAVVLKGDMPDESSIPVRLTVRGPYSTEPELRAAGCEDEKVVSEQTVDWTGKDHNRANNRYTVADLTIDGTKGLYLVTAQNEETEEVTSASTKCDNYQSVLKVSTKGTSGKTDADEDPMSTEGTNSLTGKNG